MSARFLRRAVSAAVLTSAALVGTVTLGPNANADITRCVGAVDTPGAFACYTSPRFDHIGLTRTTVVTAPVVCYGLGCTAGDLQGFLPDDQVGGRFTAVSYLGHSYTVYRPTADQPYVLATDNPHATPGETAEVLVLAALLS